MVMCMTHRLNVFKKIMKFHQNIFNGYQVIERTWFCDWQMDTDGRKRKINMPPDTIRADINNMSPNPEGGDINNIMEFLRNTVGAFVFYPYKSCSQLFFKKLKFMRNKTLHATEITSLLSTACYMNQRRSLYHFKTWHPKTGTFANSADPDEKPHNVALQLGLHHLHNQDRTTEKAIQYVFRNCSLRPLKIYNRPYQTLWKGLVVLQIVK